MSLGDQMGVEIVLAVEAIFAIHAIEAFVGVGIANVVGKIL